MWTVERRKEDIVELSSVWVDVDANEFFALQTKQKVETVVAPAPQRNFFSISQFFLTVPNKSKNSTNITCNCKTTENIGNLPHKRQTSCVLCGEKDYRICITYHSVTPLVIAMDDSKENILALWKIVESQLHTQLKMLEGEEKRLQVKNRSWQTFPGKKTVNSSLPQFILLKIMAYLREQEDLQLEDISKELSHPEGTAEFFYSLFGMDEPLHFYFSGHLWKDKLYRGGLYITDKAICFVSLLHGLAFLLPLSAIVSIEMDYIPAILTPTILIQFGKDQRYPFIPIEDSDQCLRSLKQIWRGAMNTIVKKTQEALKIASYGVDSTDERYRYLSSGRCTGSQSTNTLNTNNRSTFLSFSDFSLKYHENLLGVTYYQCPIFENPIKKIYIIAEEKCYFAYNAPKNPLRGICYMSVSCYFFHSDVQPYAITIPVREIVSITREASLIAGYETLKLIMKNEVIVYFSLQQKGDGANIFFQTWNAKTAQIEIVQEQLLTRRHFSILALKQEFFRDHLNEDMALINSWREYLEKNGRGICSVRSKQTIDLIRKGIPNQLRAEIWQIACGSLYFHQYSHEKSYKLILEEHTDSPCDKRVKSEIIRDLHRTIPEHPFFHLEEGREMLYRILIAFCWKNPNIGYCQSMNVLAGIFLLYMSEEEAFWMLCTVCEHILPGYYTESMSGNLLDQQVVSAIIAEYLPHLFLKFQSYSIDVELFTVPWFLCLFIRRLPWNASLRVLDWFLSEGSRVLFIITLSILKLFEKVIINLLENDQFLELFRTVVYENCDVDQLFQIAVDVYDQQITYEKLTYLRNAQMKIRSYVNRNSSF